VRSLDRDGRAEIYVEDTGPGIPNDVLERIFEPLFSTKNFGVGLGTNIMRNIMMRHNGGIEYANRDDTQGTRVLIWLPCSVDS
jgi:two-component system sensor histidine kinase HydH